MSANNLMAAAAPNTYEDVNDELTIQVKEYNDELVNNLRNLDHRQFFQEVRLRCFPNVKLGFMEYFITLTMMIRKFIVPGDKLREYGTFCATLRKTRKEEDPEKNILYLRKLSS